MQEIEEVLKAEKQAGISMGMDSNGTVLYPDIHESQDVEFPCWKDERDYVFKNEASLTEFEKLSMNYIILFDNIVGMEKCGDDQSFCISDLERMWNMSFCGVNV